MNELLLVSRHYYQLSMDQQFFNEPSLIQPEDSPRPVRALLPPPNPLMTKEIELDTPLHLLVKPLTPSTPPSTHRSTHHPQAVQIAQHQPIYKPIVQSQEMTRMYLTDGYDKNTLIFKRYSNENCNKRGKKEFFSSLFVGIQNGRACKLPAQRGMLTTTCDLQFSSSFESGNLMAVFQVGPCSYDLVLQNDMNTRGFTQWYNFRVRNKRKNFVARFNIVNLYKSQSLYGSGMKPMVRSQKSEKGGAAAWRRRGYNIFYDRNQLSYEDSPSKCYKTLSFQYDFTVEDDQVQFAHALPYDLTDLQRLLANIKGPRATLTTIGHTVMGRAIPMLRLASTDRSNAMQKKAIVIMGRQHPGETPGSHIAEEMIMELLKNGSEAEFLLWRFDIYVFPMVNMDGVALGNYRGNFSGYDLNRCWLRPDPVRHPEVTVIKEFIRKLAKKQPIQLILDLHGHSRKMGSFFYGNDFGNNHELYPYVASQLCPYILFPQSRFSRERKAKASTARVVLGSMIKETGHVYTYEVSFFGYYKPGKVNPFSFTSEHYHQMAHALVVGIYKTYLEIYKQEKTLRESIFLKTAKQQIQLQASKRSDNESQSGSDSEAQKEVEQEIEWLEDYYGEGIADPTQDISVPIQQKSNIIEREVSHRSHDLREYAAPTEKRDEEMKQKINEIFQKNLNEDLKNVILKRLPSLSQSRDEKIEKIDNLREAQKQYLRLTQIISSHNHLAQIDCIRKPKLSPDRLKIYGETFHLNNRSKHRSEEKSKDTLTGRLLQIQHNTPKLIIPSARQSSSKDKQPSSNTIDYNKTIMHQYDNKPFRIKSVIPASHSPQHVEIRIEDDAIRNSGVAANRIREQRIKLARIKSQSKTGKQAVIKLPMI